MSSDYRPTLSVIVPATNSPMTLDTCLQAIRRAEEPPDEVIVVDKPPLAGPGQARNSGAAEATGDVLVFVDADVVVHPDAFTRLRDRFMKDHRLAAVFGSYDDRPASQTRVSTFRNLLHHHVHQSSIGPASTFWAGLGAVRRDVFTAVGGFDATRYPMPSIEDVELGMRLSKAGWSIELDPDILGTHLKRWTLRQMVRTDFQQRGIPWVTLLLSEKSASTTLNLGWRHRLSALSCVVALSALAVRRPATSTAAAAAFVALNRDLYGLLAKRTGKKGAAYGVGLHAVHHLTGTAALLAGIAVHVRGELGPERAGKGRARSGT